MKVQQRGYKILQVPAELPKWQTQFPVWHIGHSTFGQDNGEGAKNTAILEERYPRTAEDRDYGKRFSEGTYNNQTPLVLVVDNAQYGANGFWIDVTTQVKTKIGNNPNTRFSFGNADAGRDPCFGIPKQLVVSFTVNGQQRTKTFQEFGEGSLLDL
jgi:hypothetical protein